MKKESNRREFLKATAFVAAGSFLCRESYGKDVAHNLTFMNATHDEELIKRVLKTYVDTWNRRDLDPWGRIFTADVDYVNRGGGWWQSNAENIAGHKKLFAGANPAPPTYRAETAKIAFLKEDIALVHALWQWPGVRSPSGESMFEGVMTLIMIKTEQGWLIRAVQNTVKS